MDRGCFGARRESMPKGSDTRLRSRSHLRRISWRTRRSGSGTLQIGATRHSGFPWSIGPRGYFGARQESVPKGSDTRLRLRSHLRRIPWRTRSSGLETLDIGASRSSEYPRSIGPRQMLAPPGRACPEQPKRRGGGWPRSQSSPQGRPNGPALFPTFPSAPPAALPSPRLPSLPPARAPWASRRFSALAPPGRLWLRPFRHSRAPPCRDDPVPAAGPGALRHPAEAGPRPGP